MAEPGQTTAAAARECAAITADLERLRALIARAGDFLLVICNAVSARVPQVARKDAERRELADAIGGAVTAPQFQDMAIQLAEHAQRRLDALKACVHARRAADDDSLAAGTRMRLVRPHQLSLGSIELL